MLAPSAYGEKMNVLVTAGGTCEPIDDARYISNTGTGRLGSLIADALAEKTEIDNIFYICAKSACRPATDRATVIPIFSVEDLEKAVRDLLRKERIDAVVHSMAVSDYRVRAVSTVEQLRNALAMTDDIYQALDMTDIRSGGKLRKALRSDIRQTGAHDQHLPPEGIDIGLHQRLDLHRF